MTGAARRPGSRGRPRPCPRAGSLVAKRERRRLDPGRAEERDVELRVEQDDVRVLRAPTVDGDADRLRPGDDVGVGDDVAAGARRSPCRSRRVRRPWPGRRACSTPRPRRSGRPGRSSAGRPARPGTARARRRRRAGRWRRAAAELVDVRRRGREHVADRPDRPASAGPGRPSAGRGRPRAGRRRARRRGGPGPPGERAGDPVEPPRTPLPRRRPIVAPRLDPIASPIPIATSRATSTPTARSAGIDPVEQPARVGQEEDDGDPADGGADEAEELGEEARSPARHEAEPEEDDDPDVEAGSPGKYRGRGWISSPTGRPGSGRRPGISSRRPGRGWRRRPRRSSRSRVRARRGRRSSP